MAFWLHEPRFLLSLRFLAPRYKCIVIGLFCGVIVALWTLVLFFPAREKLHQELRAQQDLLQQTIAFEKVANKLEALTIERNKLETQIKSFDIQPATIHESIDFLVNTLRKHRILCKHIEPKQQKQQIKSFFEKEYCTLILVGSFMQMLMFLDEIKKSKRLITFKTVDLVRGKDNTVTLTAVVRIARLL